MVIFIALLLFGGIKENLINLYILRRRGKK